MGGVMQEWRAMLLWLAICAAFMACVWYLPLPL